MKNKNKNIILPEWTFDGKAELWFYRPLQKKSSQYRVVMLEGLVKVFNADKYPKNKQEFLDAASLSTRKFNEEDVIKATKDLQQWLWEKGYINQAQILTLKGESNG